MPVSAARCWASEKLLSSLMGRFAQLVRSNGWYLAGNELCSRISGRIRSRLLAHHLKTDGLYIGRYSRLKGITNLRVGKDFHAGDGLWIEAVVRYEEQVFQPKIRIGDHVRASNWVHISCTNLVEIGDNCLIGSKVMIVDHGHGSYTGATQSPPLEPPAKRLLDSGRQVIIGPNVWLGDGVVVMPDVEIGEGAVIGANSVVARDIPAFTIAVGAPAKPIKKYDFEAKTWVEC